MKARAVLELTRDTASDEVSAWEVEIWKKIKRTLNSGRDVEIRKTSDGNFKVLEIQKKNIIG